MRVSQSQTRFIEGVEGVLGKYDAKLKDINNKVSYTAYHSEHIYSYDIHRSGQTLN